jgi:hypothetical protein
MLRGATSFPVPAIPSKSAATGLIGNHPDLADFESTPEARALPSTGTSQFQGPLGVVAATPVAAFGQNLHSAGGFLRSQAAQVQAGNVFPVAGAWVAGFLEEAECFGKFKDQIDAATVGATDQQTRIESGCLQP